VNPVAQAEAAPHDAPAIEQAAMDPFDALPLPYIEIDTRGIITRVNHAVLARHPLERGELIGRIAWDLMAADEKDPSFAAYCLALESGEEPEAVRRSLYDRSGQFRTYEMHRSLMRDADGNPCGMRMLCVDVTETRKELEDARRRNAKLESVIESMCTAVLVTDAVGFIRSANPAAEELLGWQTSELRGVSIEEGFPVLAYLGGGRSELTFSMALEGPSKGLATVLDRQRREVHIELGTSPILDKETGTTIGVVLVLHKLEVP
jgi:PAS domain S-box-containing protein